LYFCSLTQYRVFITPHNPQAFRALNERSFDSGVLGLGLEA
jgi:hypothetical protein